MRKKLFRRTRADYSLAITALGLMGFGAVMIYSASVFIGAKYYSTDPTLFFKRQLVALFLAVVGWVIVQQIDYHHWKKISSGLMIVTILLLILVLFFPEINSSHSWFVFGPLQFQPSELAKLTLILYLASWFDRRGEEIKSLKYGFLPFITILGVISLLILAQPDLGTLAVIFIICSLLYFFAGAPLSHFGLGGVLAALLFWLEIWHSDYRRERLLTFLNPERNSLDAAYHIQNILIAVGSGSWWGIGFGESRQKRGFLPEPHTDSIFAVIVEELGFIRALLILLALLYVIIRIFRIAVLAPDNFGRYVAAGVASWILSQSAINLAAMLGLLPLTGIPLPFISSGGSSLVMLGLALGITLNISKQIPNQDTK